MAFSFCPRCGTPRLGAFRFCRTCELDFDALTSAPPTEPPPPASVPPPVASDHSRVPLWIVAAGACLAGIVWLWLNVGPYDLSAQLLIVVLWGALWIGIVAVAVRLVILALGRAGHDVRPVRPRK
jgi:hypothetical protein